MLGVTGSGTMGHSNANALIVRMEYFLLVVELHFSHDWKEISYRPPLSLTCGGFQWLRGLLEVAAWSVLIAKFHAAGIWPGSGGGLKINCGYVAFLDHI